MIKPSIISDKNTKSYRIKLFLGKKIKFFSPSKSNLIIVVGGDGFMLQTLKKYYKLKKAFYGINSGNYGFLMNKFSKKNTIKNLPKAKAVSIKPLEMIVKNKFGKIKKSIAINEVSILRQSRQAASVSIRSGNKTINWALPLKSMAMATSGDYKNYYEIDGIRYSHEIDPRTGYPAKTGIASATVVASNCMDADALATALIIMGVESGLQFIEKLDGVEAFLIVREGNDNNYRTIKSSGMKISTL